MVPLWIFVLSVIVALAVAMVVGREQRPHCARCGHLLPPRHQITDRYSDGASDICLTCFLDTFR
jgi:hypothetical protein